MAKLVLQQDSQRTKICDIFVLLEFYPSRLQRCCRSCATPNKPDRSSTAVSNNFYLNASFQAHSQSPYFNSNPYLQFPIPNLNVPPQSPSKFISKYKFVAPIPITVPNPIQIPIPIHILFLIPILIPILIQIQFNPIPRGLWYNIF